MVVDVANGRYLDKIDILNLSLDASRTGGSMVEFRKHVWRVGVFGAFHLRSCGGC